MELLPEYSTYAIPMDEIWVDSDFNCRDRFLPESVRTLADDIKASGLTYPLLVQPWDQPPYCYRLIAGFRRHAACRMLRMVKVPAMVTEKDITEFEAHKLNFMENLERKDLNILEEARGITRLFPNGATTSEVAREVGKTTQWVHRRMALLDLPLEVQLMFASGRMVQNDLDVLIPMRNDAEAVRKAAHAILDARLESTHEAVKVRSRLKRGRAVADSRKTKAEIGRMIGRMFDMGIHGIPTRIAAWCAGGVSDEEMIVDLRRYVKRFRSGRPKPRRKSREKVSGEG